MSVQKFKLKGQIMYNKLSKLAGSMTAQLCENMMLMSQKHKPKTLLVLFSFASLTIPKKYFLKT